MRSLPLLTEMGAKLTLCGRNRKTAFKTETLEAAVPWRGRVKKRLSLKQYAVFRFNRFEISLFAKHDPHVDFNTARNKRDWNIIRAPFKRI